MLRRFLALLLFVFFIQTLFAQKKIVAEKIRCMSTSGPVMNYWQNPETRKTLITQLGQTLSQYQHLPPMDTSRLNIQLLENGYDVRPVKPDFIDEDSTHLHLYMDMFEVYPETFFAVAENNPNDSMMRKRARSVFIINAWILSHEKKILFNETLNILVQPGETPGIGILYGNEILGKYLTVTPRGFTEMFRAATNLLFDPANELITVEMKVSPAYFTDNFIFAKTTGLPRVYVSTTKNICTYLFRDKSEMIRKGDAVYEEMKVRGRKAEKYPDELMNAVKNVPNYFVSDFVFLRQEWRDVMRDKNYLLKITVQVNPEKPPELGPAFAFTNFLPGSFHYLFLEKDTLARFVIEKAVADNEKKIYVDKISNGYDSLSFYNIKSSRSEMRIVYDYVVTGSIASHGFQVKCSGFRNMLKEFYLDKKLVCIAQGKFSPEKFVVFDASLSPELLNQLFMIGFNCFFE